MGPGASTRTPRWGLEIANLQSRFLRPFLFERRGKKDALYIYFMRRLPVV